MLRFRSSSVSPRNGHDVLAVTELHSGSPDTEIMELAISQNRILVTEDKDFGWLVFAAGVNSPGVILIRFPASARSLLAESVVRLVSEHSSKRVGAFVVLRPGVARIGLRTLHAR